MAFLFEGQSSERLVNGGGAHGGDGAIAADGEARARQRLAQAEAFRLEAVGKANAEQMAREGSLLSRHPLLIQKVMADKLSDKVQVIIAAPGADGGFIGSGLLGHPGKAVALASGADANEGEEE